MPRVLFNPSIMISRSKVSTASSRESVYKGLHRVIGRRKTSGFIDDFLRPCVLRKSLEAAYQQMAQDEAPESTVLEWVEATTQRKKGHLRMETIGFQIIDFTRIEGAMRVRRTGWYVVENFDR